VTQMDALAEAAAVWRRFGAFTAVHAVDLAGAAGEVVGLLGANGAGKTTLIRLLLGLLRPSQGSVRLFGVPPSVAGRRRVGYMPQTLGLYTDLTVAENWSFTAAAFGIRAALPSSVAGVRNELVGALPLGTQREVAFAVALAHRPELLVLDEPTSGVGPLGRARLWEEIRQAADHGAGVLVTTHNIEEAQECDRLVVMADGRVVVGGTVADIIGDREVAEVRSADWARAFTVLDREGFEVQVHGQGVLRVTGQPEGVRTALASAGIGAEVRMVGANLEEAFVAIASGTARAGSTA